ncbi:hypothetical protein [Arthrobacter oryzae]|uniref:hypothetical protein n=1 Tax=Arthrobacter oryzae TaxID=409290 RepID=UPI003593741C
MPNDIAVVSFDGTSESEVSWPQLTTVRQPIDRREGSCGSPVTGRAGRRDRAPHHRTHSSQVLWLLTLESR